MTPVRLTVLPPLDRLQDDPHAPRLDPEAPVPWGPLSARDQRRYHEIYQWLVSTNSDRRMSDAHAELLRGAVPRGDGAASHKMSHGRRDGLLFYRQAMTGSFNLHFAVGLLAAHALGCETDEILDVMQLGRARGIGPEVTLKKAGAVLRQLEVPGMAAAIYEESLAYNDQDPEVYGCLGLLAMDAHQYPKALMWFEQARALPAELPQPLYAKAGQACTLLHEFEQALIWYNAGLAQEPDDVQCLAGAASALSQLQNPEACNDMIVRALAHNPDGMAVRCLALAAGETANAAALLQIRSLVLKNYPNDALLHELLAGAFERAGEPQHALAFYATALARDPQDLRLYIHVAKLRIAMNQDAMALKMIERALALPQPATPDPLTTILHAFAVRLLADQDDTGAKQRAATLVRRMLRTDPHNAELHGQLGCLLCDIAGRGTVEAGDAFWNAAKYGPGHPSLWRSIASCYRGKSDKLGRREKALREVVQACPDDLQSKELLAEIIRGDRREVKALLTEVYHAIDGPALAAAGLVRCIERPQFRDMIRKELPKSACTFTHAGACVEGTVMGYTYHGQVAAVDKQGQRYWAGFQNVAIVAVPRTAAVQTVPRAMHYRLSPAQQQRLDARLQENVVGHLCLQQVLDRLNHSKFEEGLVTGGVLARLLSGEDLQGNVDVDVVTTLLPQLVRYTLTSLYNQTADAAAPGTAEATLFSSKDHSIFHGVVTLGSLPGLDIATVRVGGMYESRTPMLGAAKPVFPVVFGHDLMADAMARDFTCNALYYDPVHKEILDPTGSGIADALAKRLRVPSESYVLKNDSLALRFCRMRQRGWDADVHTRALMRDNAAKFFCDPDTGRLLQNLTKAAAHAVKGADNLAQAVTSWMHELLDTMHANGFGDLGTRYVAPLIDAVVTRLQAAAAV